MSVILTHKDIEQDVWNREVVKIVVRKGPETAAFRMRYGEFFPEAMSDEATVAELGLRIDTYLKTQRID